MRTHRDRLASVRGPLLTLLASACLLVAGSRVRADDVVLAGGTRLTGVVLERGAERVRLLLPAGDELTLEARDVAEVVPDEDAPKGDKVVRYASASKAKGTPEGLEVALLHFVHPATGRRVDLVSAVHIADMDYFRRVQRLLEDADRVLYELVKPREAEPEDVPDDPHPVREFQKKLAGWFNFAFQLDGISYDRPHFVHADLTMEEFEVAAGGLKAKPGADGVPPKEGAPEKPGLASILGDMSGQIAMIEGLFKAMGMDDPVRGPKVRRSVKVLLGRMLGAMGSKVGLLLGAETSELLISKRNAVVLEKLKELPESARSVAVFYGAAHLPDLEKRLVAAGYERVGGRWLLAWDLTEVPAGK